MSNTLACRSALCAAAALLLAGCTMPPPGQYAARITCEIHLGSRVCNPEPDAPESGDGLSQPDVLTHIQGPGH